MAIAPDRRTEFRRRRLLLIMNRGRTNRGRRFFLKFITTMEVQNPGHPSSRPFTGTIRMHPGCTSSSLVTIPLHMTVRGQRAIHHHARPNRSGRRLIILEGDETETVSDADTHITRIQVHSSGAQNSRTPVPPTPRMITSRPARPCSRIHLDRPTPCDALSATTSPRRRRACGPRRGAGRLPAAGARGRPARSAPA